MSSGDDQGFNALGTDNEVNELVHSGFSGVAGSFHGVSVHVMASPSSQRFLWARCIAKVEGVVSVSNKRAICKPRRRNILWEHTYQRLMTGLFSGAEAIRNRAGMRTNIGANAETWGRCNAVKFTLASSRICVSPDFILTTTTTFLPWHKY